MSETGEILPRPTDTVGRFLYTISRFFSVIGGIVLCSIALVTAISVSGRYFLNAPIAGDYELVEIGTGLSVFLFLPFCQMVRENVIVDFFMSGAPERLKTFFDAIGCLLYGAIMVLMTWRLSYGGVDMYNTQETTGVLDIPRWLSFPVAIACLMLLIAVIIYTFSRDTKALISDETS
ncbi:MAG: TRAP transporter small permease [Rhodospirillales bacterium]|jgi:TRAP-type C4-dicarboxylate transport system permease small subunit|nr:hypothetical protein [Rhodospirillaceae bacterium]MDP6646636.1 TRAP transporter small permease [Rhodospirillales bacterium]MDP6842832.1 TRAP transporter small permease [Rhodospirillales bacterium]|tara:strand:+ start:298 stop:828 length:531 start_codon:yes stop_codon:yes gene_type:complete